MRRVLPPTYFLLAIVACVALHFALPIRQIFASPWRWLGCISLAAGIALNLLADREFKQRGTAVKPFETSTALVTNGVFAITRNPMYLGMTLMLFGVAVLLGSLGPLVVAPLFALSIDRLFIVGEERMLAETFGAEFQTYCGRVRRWL